MVVTFNQSCNFDVLLDLESLESYLASQYIIYREDKKPDTLTVIDIQTDMRLYDQTRPEVQVGQISGCSVP